ncbi:galactose-3-O-sulfotransferase 3 [Elysia marginata]|uniref:Galactose-3-O-sulfotransferase 3 n=1 Tax=Elysia marginata TaxID=1093978 RepID=A0AAV4GPC0_9GAST|nr:galactose-3-O-sulfotransferase 3 [Elysia marginata]
MSPSIPDIHSAVDKRNQPVRDEREVIASDLAKLKQHLDIHPERSDLGSRPVEGQLSYLGQVISDNVTQEMRTCTPVVNIAFVKTHKAGSSTIANILQRFGISRNLSFALPNTKYRSYGYNYISRAGDVLTPSRLLPLKDGSHQGYNILTNHAIYNRTAFRLFMPRDTHYISILREPFSQFVSAFEYYGAKSMFSKRDKSILTAENPISSYLQNPYKFERTLHYFSYVKNKQAEDLGLGWNEYFMPAKLTHYLQTLNDDFTLVMIMEFFDESLLLLKRKLCWDLKDILYIPKNTNKHKPKRNFTETDHKRHEKLSHLDYKLYSFFLKSFKAELQNQGRDFFEELGYFRNILKKVHHSCTTNTAFYTAETRWHEAFHLDKVDCRLMLINELSGFDLLLERAGVLDRSSKTAIGTKAAVGKYGGKGQVIEKAGLKGQGDKQVWVKLDGVKKDGTKVQEGALEGKKHLEVGQVRVQGQEDIRLVGEGHSVEKAGTKVAGDVHFVDKGQGVKYNDNRGRDASQRDQLPVNVVLGNGFGYGQAVIQGEQLAKVESGIKVDTAGKV